jgi:uncharacterized protein
VKTNALAKRQKTPPQFQQSANLDSFSALGLYSQPVAGTDHIAAKAALCVMRYRVRAKLSQPLGRVVCDVDGPVPVGAGAIFAGPVRGQIVLTNAGAAISARGRLSATMVAECYRCLARHEVPLDVEVNEECRLAQIDQPPGAEADEASAIPILDADEVDLTELIRQVLALAVPQRSLCRPDCRGLCPTCGHNLNLGPCSCQQPPNTSVWDVLKDRGPS